MSLPENLPIFELLVLEKEELPQVCVGVSGLQTPVKTCEQVHFDIIHLNDTPRAQSGTVDGIDVIIMIIPSITNWIF